jgi:hypothetical protein
MKVTRTRPMEYRNLISTNCLRTVQTNFQTLKLLCKPYFNQCKVSIFIETLNYWKDSTGNEPPLSPRIV